jgi:hypothetical protein
MPKGTVLFKRSTIKRFIRAADEVVLVTTEASVKPDGTLILSFAKPPTFEETAPELSREIDKHLESTWDRANEWDNHDKPSA